MMTKRIGGTKYKVRITFNENGQETMEDKVLRMIRNDLDHEPGGKRLQERKQKRREINRRYYEKKKAREQPAQADEQKIA